MQRNYKRKEKKRHSVLVGMAAPRARAEAAFTPGWYYQPGLEVPNQSRLRGPRLKPGLYTRIGSPGWETGTRGGFPTGTETHSCTSVLIIIGW